MTDRILHQPVDATAVPRFAGPATFMRLPLLADPAGLDVALFGIPFDAGTTNRPGARHGPREVRNQSSLMRLVNHATKVAPYAHLSVADLGDVAINPFGIEESLAAIEAFVAGVAEVGARPLACGGDHLVTLPILRALARERPLGLVHFDAHSDTNDRYFGDNRLTHGTPFRRAIEEGLLDPRRMIQIGIRGSLYDPGEHDWARAQGVTILYIEDVGRLGLDAVMEEARRVTGGGPVYVSFDIDSLDPSFAPGTGTPEIGGLTSREAQAMLRCLGTFDIAGADMVEVSPPLDPSGLTALTGATVMFELLCAMAGQD